MASPNHVGSNGFSHQLGTVLLWFRRDLRVADNPALCAAVQAARYVVRNCSVFLLMMTSNRSCSLVWVLGL